MKKSLLYTTCLGVNNNLAASRLLYNEEKGLAELVSAYNMLIDRSGGLSSRGGTLQAASGEFHSGFALDSVSFLCIKEGITSASLQKAIVSPGGSISLHTLRSGLTKNSRMSYWLFNKEVYYMNGFEYGAVDNIGSHVWPDSEWPRESTIPFLKVGPGKNLTMIGGRFVFSIGNEITWTEVDLIGLVNPENSLEFESEVILCAATKSGVYVSDREYVYFLAGPDPDAWEANIVLSYPALEGAINQTLVDPTQFGLETSRPALLFGTSQGPCIGLAEGQVFNLVNKKVTTPVDCLTGSMMVVDKSLIIQSGV